MALNNEKSMPHMYGGAESIITYDHMAENNQNTIQNQTTKKVNLTSFIIEELFLIAMGVVCLCLYI